MKRISIILLFFAAIYNTHAQTKPGPKETIILDSVCNCITKLDMSKINTSKQANDAFEDCFTRQSALLVEVAKEHNVEMTDEVAMNKLGVEIGENLMSNNCSAALKLGVKMSNDDKSDDVSTSEGVIKRIDQKGFNYLIIADEKNQEKSFIWLRQFTGSEKFMANTTDYVGKKVKIGWKEMEVYLPEAKGYYTVKEIVSVEFL
jgi:hypothetical protein